MPIRVVLRDSEQELELPVSVERDLRKLPQDQGGRGIRDEDLNRIQQELDGDGPARAAYDSNEDSVGAVGEIAFVADGGFVRRVVLEGLQRRLRYPIDDQETVLLTGRRT